MSQGTEYSGYGSHSAAGSPEEEIWFVAVAPNDIQQMTLDQLDEAYSSGRITEQTAVWTDGMEQWAPLAEVANMSEEEEAGAAPEPPAVQPVSHHVAQPHPAAHTHGSSGHASSAYAPVSHMGGPGQQVIAAHDLPAANIQEAPGFQQSTAPVALSLEDELPEQPPKSRRRLGVWLLAVAGVAAAGFTLVRSDVLSGGDKPEAKNRAAEATLAAQPYDPGPASKAEASPKAEAPAKAASDSKLAAQAKAEASGDAPIGSVGAKAKAGEDGTDESADKAKKSSLKRSFSGALKRKSKGKARKSRSRKRRAARSTRAARRKTKKKAAPKKKVKRTSSAFDPLNGSLP